MTDAEYAAERERIKRFFLQWVDLLCFGSWRLTMEYEREESTAPVTGTQYGEGRWARSFVCNVDWRFMAGTITAYLPQTKHLDEAELEEHVVHELAHVILNETRASDKSDWLDHEERVATVLSRSLIRVRDYANEASANARND